MTHVTSTDLWSNGIQDQLYGTTATHYFKQSLDVAPARSCANCSSTWLKRGGDLYSILCTPNQTYAMTVDRETERQRDREDRETAKAQRGFFQTKQDKGEAAKKPTQSRYTSQLFLRTEFQKKILTRFTNQALASSSTFPFYRYRHYHHVVVPGRAPLVLRCVAA